MATLVYDADCGFCTSCALWVEKRAKGSRQARSAVVIAPWQSLDLAAHSLTEQDVMDAAWWLAADHQLSGARAVAAALRACGLPWSVLGRLIDLPPLRPLARVVYRWVARNRYRLPGSTCAVPERPVPPEVS